MGNFAPIFKGWNVWAVFQKDDLDFEASMVGLDRDRRLRIWVEERAEGAGADVSDAVKLKGSMVEILPSAPALDTAARKEGVEGPAMLLDGPAGVRFVRFFNRGQGTQLLWPHDSNYLLDQVYQPSADAPETSAPPPSTTLGGPAHELGETLKGAGEFVLAAGVVVGAIWLWSKFK